MYVDSIKIVKPLFEYEKMISQDDLMEIEVLLVNIIRINICGVKTKWVA
jgi:hypothetical protein